MLRSPLALAAMFVLFTLQACQDTTVPGGTAGTFALRDIASTALPVTYYSGTDGTYTVLADTIELDGAGNVNRTFLIRRTASIYGADTVYRNRGVQEYRLDGTRIEIGSFKPCPPDALCAANDTGRFYGGVMRLGSFRTGQLRRWSYDRIAPLPQ